MAAIFLVLFYPSPSLNAGKAPSDPGISKTILDNGLTLVIKPTPNLSLVSIFVCVRAGLSNEGDFAGSGISHFIEHMIFKGSEKRPPGTVEKEIKSYGGYINAYTGMDSSCYYVTVPSEYFKEALELLSDVTINAKFDEKEFVNERNVILNEMRFKDDDPSYRVMRLLWSTAYLYHPYKYPIIGYQDLFKEIAGPDLAGFHAARYNPNNIVLVIAGDIDSIEAENAVRDIFLNYGRGKALDAAAPQEPPQIATRKAKEHIETNLGYLAVGYHTTGLMDEDLFATDLLSIILGQGEDSRLYKALVKDKELLYSVSSSNYTPRYPGLFIVQGIGKPENIEEAQKHILIEIEKLKTEGIDEEEVLRAKKMVLTSYLRSLETTEGMARTIAQGELLAGDPDFSKRYVEGVKKVKTADVINAAKKYLDENNLSSAAVLPKSKEEKSALPGNSRSSNPMPEMAVLDNGMRLIVKEDGRIPMISIVCSLKGGLMAEAGDENGVSNLASRMLLKGTAKRKEFEIVPAMERRGADIGSFSGYNSFGISMSFMKEDKDLALDIFEDIVKNPNFPENELRREKDKIYAAILSEDDDMFDKGFLAFRKELFRDHPYGRRILGEEPIVEQLTREKAADFYRRWNAPQNFVISAVGDFDKNEILADLSKRFKDMRGPVKTPQFSVAPPEKPSGKRDVRFHMHKEEALVILGFQGAGIMNKDKHTLEVLASVLSGHDGRMHKNIRETLGAAYALDVYSKPGVDTGFVLFYVACSPKNADLVIDNLIKEIIRIRKEPVEEAELESARRELKTRHRMALQSSSGLAMRMCLDELFGPGYADYLAYEKAISGVTKEDVRKTAMAYMDPERYTLVVITPFKDAAE